MLCGDGLRNPVITDSEFIEERLKFCDEKTNCVTRSSGKN
jgi:hypothetical protein